MIYEVYDSKIIVKDLTHFVPKHILECGQMFRYVKNSNNYKVFSKNYSCILIIDKFSVIINTSDVEYFVEYFDLDRDYSVITDRLSSYQILKDATTFGRGIRILRQNPVETIFSFIISANNNISRIRQIIENLCVKFGTKMGDYYAFPTIESLVKNATLDSLKDTGIGYRASYLIKTAHLLNEGFNLDISHMSTGDARQHLMQLPGVGPKVADCILLFGYARYDVFPTDTWISKAYNELYDNEKLSRTHIAKKFVDEFGDIAGFAQQYLFYSYRERNNI
ncbi:MAG: 8-oxoguanine DNA glycosylase [Christensenellaceae bacterium]|nr:8-oxoguanine DNA glycosylase [Christensenellaceae bacterium]